MKHFAYFVLLTLVLMSCGTDNRHFKLDGRLLHLNQGEFYVYSPEGIVKGMDTIKIAGGRFTYEIPCDRKGTLMIVFPNFYEQPVFATPGEKVDVQGDASHLKELEVKGTKDNELMTQFRKRTSSASPPEVIAFAEQFIHDHPQSIVGKYLVGKYFLQSPKPDYQKAKKLVAFMVENQPREGSLIRLQKQLSVGHLAVGSTLPQFSTNDINGNTVSSQSLKSAHLVVLNVWSTWSYESLSTMMRLNYLQKKYGGQLKVVGICLDGSLKECRQTLSRDSIKWSNICDEQMFESKLVRQLGLSSIPDNIILKNGVVVAKSLDLQALEKKIQELI